MAATVEVATVAAEIAEAAMAMVEMAEEAMVEAATVETGLRRARDAAGSSDGGHGDRALLGDVLPRRLSPGGIRDGQDSHSSDSQSSTYSKRSSL